MRKASVLMSEPEFVAARRRSQKPLLYLSLVSFVMIFAALSSAYIVMMERDNFSTFDLPSMFTFSTLTIIISSVTMGLAQWAARRNKTQLIGPMILATIFLSGLFVYFQFMGWKQLTQIGWYPVGSNAGATFLAVFPVVHMMHLAGGIISLLFTFTKSVMKKYSAEDYLGVDLCGIYWHFLSVIWLYIFLFLIFIR